MNKNKIISSVLGIFLLILVVMVVTYAAFTFSGLGTTENSITTGSITMTYTEGKNGITLNNVMPTTDEVGKRLQIRIKCLISQWIIV